MPITLKHKGDIAVTNGTITIDGSPIGGGGGGGFTFYDVTLADCENTASPVDVASITVPANTWGDGEIVYFEIGADFNNLSGGTVTPSVGYTGTGITGYTAIGNWNNGLSGQRGWIRMAMARSGAGVYTMSAAMSETGNYSYPKDITILRYPSLLKSQGVMPYDTSVDFTVDITIKYTLELLTADPTLWMRPSFGVAYKTEKGASL